MKQILVFILFSAMICWMMFSPVYKHIVILRQALLEQEVDYLLEVGASGTYGYISEEMQNESMERLEQFGLKRDLLHYNWNTTTGADPTNAHSPIPRGVGIELSISYPYEKLFQIDALMGISPIGENERMYAYGMKMSEYVEPLE